MKHNLTQFLKIVILSLIIGLGVNYLYAQGGWQDPPASPPDGNPPPPINASIDLQTKIGGLGVGALHSLSEIWADDKVGIGTTSPAVALDVYPTGVISDQCVGQHWPPCGSYDESMCDSIEGCSWVGGNVAAAFHGDVGIGTSNPQESLEVVGGAILAGEPNAKNIVRIGDPKGGGGSNPDSRYPINLFGSPESGWTRAYMGIDSPSGEFMIYPMDAAGSFDKMTVKFDDTDTGLLDVKGNVDITADNARVILESTTAPHAVYSARSQNSRGWVGAADWFADGEGGFGMYHTDDETYWNAMVLENGGGAVVSEGLEVKRGYFKLPAFESSPPSSDCNSEDHVGRMAIVKTTVGGYLDDDGQWHPQVNDVWLPYICTGTGEKTTTERVMITDNTPDITDLPGVSNPCYITHDEHVSNRLYGGGFLNDSASEYCSERGYDGFYRREPSHWGARSYRPFFNETSDQWECWDDREGSVMDYIICYRYETRTVPADYSWERMITENYNY